MANIATSADDLDDRRDSRDHAPVVGDVSATPPPRLCWTSLCPARMLLLLSPAVNQISSGADADIRRS